MTDRASTLRIARTALIVVATVAATLPPSLRQIAAAPPVRERPISATAIGRASAEDERAIDSVLARLSIRAKAAQMIMPWMLGGLDPGDREFRRTAQLVAAHGVGGIIVGKGDRHATTRSVRALQTRSKVPLLIASDLEWGAGMRLLGATLLPPAMAVAATGDTALAYEHGRVTAAEARASGFHLTLGPVLDVNVNPRNPIISTRSFGEDPVVVARFGAASIRGLQDGGLLAVGKHFPGHGDTDDDSHIALPTLTGSRARLDSVELVPFRAAVRAGIGGIMVGHLSAPALGTGVMPASLSRPVATTLLREQMGFEGLVFTDALNMAGATRGRTLAELTLQAVTAGADILLQPTDPEAAIDAIVAGVSRGDISRERIDASVRRILRAKARAGLLGGSRASPDRGADGSSPLSASAVADSIAALSITLVRDSAALLPMRGARPVLSVTYASGVGVPGGASEAFDATLRRSGLPVTRLTLPARVAPAVADSLITAWEGSSSPPLVILSSYTLPIPGQGAVGLPPAVAASVERIARRTSLVHIAFGGPYVAASVPSARTVLLAWTGIPAAQRAAARIILGEREATGRLPVSLPSN